MDFSPQQDNALRSVDDWLQNGDQQVFRLFGYAGTGKTTLAKHFAANVEGRVAFGAYTGKAAHVLRQKGCPASTIHSMIYHVHDKSTTYLQNLETEYARISLLERTPAMADQMKQLETKIAAERDALRRPGFTLNHDSDIRYASLIVIDECSMVDARMGEDLLSFGVKVLVLGDPAQLPPVGSGGFFTEQTPDVMLTEIHRQAADSPIIHLATQVREGKTLSLGNYGSSNIILKDKLNKDLAMAADQILVGKNKTRFSVNQRMRFYKGHEGICMEGDKVVCLRNNNDEGLLNGSIWNVTNFCPGEEEGQCYLGIQDGETEMTVLAHTHYFTGHDKDLTWWQRKEAEEFDFGYALTVHKAQGSQWNDVLLFDESFAFRNDAKRWLYTAITRAAEKITIVR